MSRKEQIISELKSLIALTLVGGIAATVGGCAKEPKKEETDENSNVITHNITSREQDEDAKVLRKVYGKYPRFIKLPEQYDYKYFLEINGQTKVAALIGEHTFTQKVDLFDGKEAMAAAYFYHYRPMIKVPDTLNITDAESYYHFIKNFIPEVTYRVFKDINNKYYVETTLKYTLNENCDKSLYMLISDKELKVTLVQEVDYNRYDDTLNSEYLYRVQTGIGEDCQNVQDANYGSYSCKSIEPGEVYSYSEERNVNTPVTEDITLQRNNSIRLKR